MALELLTFLCLALVLEGLILALFPGLLRRALEQFSALPTQQLRAAGLVIAAAAVALLYGLSLLTVEEGEGLSFGFSQTRRMVAGLF